MEKMWTWIRPQTSLYEDTGTVEYQLLQSRVLPASLIHLPTHLCNLAVFWSYLAIICWDILGHPDVREFEAPNLQCHLSLSFQCAGQKAHERQKWWWEFSFRPKRCIIWCFSCPSKTVEGSYIWRSYNHKLEDLWRKVMMLVHRDKSPSMINDPKSEIDGWKETTVYHVYDQMANDCTFHKHG